MKNPIRLNILLFATAAFAGPLSASSISFVTTATSVFNASSDYDSVQGLRENAGSCYQTGTTNLGPCASVAASPSSNILGATAATTSTLNGVNYDPHTNASAYGSAYASANLATGYLGAFTLGPNCSIPDFSGCGSGGYAVAEMQDNLTFNNTTGRTANIGITWTFDGTTGTTGIFFNEQIDALLCFASGSLCSGLPNSQFHPPINAGQSFTSSYTSNRDGQGIVQTTSTTTLPTTGGWVTTAYTPGMNATSENFQGIFAVPAGVSTDSLNAYLQVYCLLSNCDFSHTAVLNIAQLPAGVSYTSASGVLLTASTPEPATWMLFMLGVAALALVRVFGVRGQFKRGALTPLSRSRLFCRETSCTSQAHPQASPYA